ncbi:MAG: NTP transferase domain-containing protein [Syntrophomonadaceae bacterium]|nr:NTP transferase domain-containing protein [Syntrophomonadaceae bacterium]
MISVILAGGKGVRLWPESREARPKQLCHFFGNKSMLEHTVDRLAAAGSEEILIITNQSQVEPVARVLSENKYRDKIEIVGEPLGRNTAPAIGLALARYLPGRGDDVLAIFPSDHYIRDTQAFREVIQKAVQVAGEGYLVTVGITPTYPETGYGYIKKSARAIGTVEGAFEVEAFKEKPDLQSAVRYVESGEYFWNAGIFIGKVSTVAEEYARYLPEVYRLIEQGYEIYLANYENLPNISMDYGIMEKSDRVGVVSGDLGWSDVGSWKALAELLEPDQHNNVLVGDDILAVDVRNCLVKQSEKTLALLGVKDLVIVETRDVIMICPKEESQNVRKIVDLLVEQGRDVLL